MPKTHYIPASGKTCHWGVFAADIPPVLEIDSGDTVVIEAISGAPAVLPGPPFTVPPS